MKWSQLFKQFWINRYGTLTYKNGRWFRYHFYTHEQSLPETLSEKTSLNVIFYDCHKIISSDSLVEVLFTRNSPKLIKVPSARILIDRSQSNIYAPGLNFHDYIAGKKGVIALYITTATEDQPFSYVWTELLGDIVMVGFENPTDQVLFKLAHG